MSFQPSRMALGLAGAYVVAIILYLLLKPTESIPISFLIDKPQFILKTESLEALEQIPESKRFHRAKLCLSDVMEALEPLQAYVKYSPDKTSLAMNEQGVLLLNYLDAPIPDEAWAASSESMQEREFMGLTIITFNKIPSLHFFWEDEMMLCADNPVLLESALRSKSKLHFRDKLPEIQKRSSTLFVREYFDSANRTWTVLPHLMHGELRKDSGQVVFGQEKMGDLLSLEGFGGVSIHQLAFSPQGTKHWDNIPVHLLEEKATMVGLDFPDVYAAPTICGVLRNQGRKKRFAAWKGKPWPWWEKQFAIAKESGIGEVSKRKYLGQETTVLSCSGLPLSLWFEDGNERVYVFASGDWTCAVEDSDEISEVKQLIRAPIFQGDTAYFREISAQGELMEYWKHASGRGRMRFSPWQEKEVAFLLSTPKPLGLKAGEELLVMGFDTDFLLQDEDDSVVLSSAVGRHYFGYQAEYEVAAAMSFEGKNYFCDGNKLIGVSPQGQVLKGFPVEVDSQQIVGLYPSGDAALWVELDDERMIKVSLRTGQKVHEVVSLGGGLAMPPQEASIGEVKATVCITEQGIVHLFDSKGRYFEGFPVFTHLELSDRVWVQAASTFAESAVVLMATDGELIELSFEGKVLDRHRYANKDYSSFQLLVAQGEGYVLKGKNRRIALMKIGKRRAQNRFSEKPVATMFLPEGCRSSEYAFLLDGIDGQLILLAKSWLRDENYIFDAKTKDAGSIVVRGEILKWDVEGSKATLVAREESGRIVVYEGHSTP